MHSASPWGGDPFSHPSGASVSRRIRVKDPAVAGSFFGLFAAHALLPVAR